MPNQPATPHRTLRIPDEIWDEMKRITSDRGETITAVTIRAYVRYIREFGDDRDDMPPGPKVSRPDRP